MPDALQPIVTAVLSSAAVLLILQIVHVVLRRIGRRRTLVDDLVRRAHRPTQLLLVVVATYVSLQRTTQTGDWRGPLLHAVGLVGIAVGAWLVAELLMVLEEGALARIRTDVVDNRHARRIHTQVRLARRVTVMIIAVLAVGLMLLTFPAARTAGASLLASAGIVGAIAALAAQSLLGNVFAGLQLAFSDALRLDDVVVVEGQWGRIEEITLSYVAVRLWDDRRLILPPSHFTTKPFEHWSRTTTAVSGAVFLDLDWTVPVQPLREELGRILAETSLWDGRAGILQVTGAENGMVRLRCVVSATNAGELWDLRCLVREQLVEWVRDRHPDALPRMRADVEASTLTALTPSGT